MTLSMWEQEKFAQGLEQGLKQGRNEGLKQGRNEGLKQGRHEGLLETIKNLMETLRLSAAEAMAAMKIPPAEQPRYAALL